MRQSPAAGVTKWQRLRRFSFIVSLAIHLGNVLSAQTAVAQVGIFESHADVGTVLHPGSAEYDSVEKSYTITGSGENMWSTADAFQFVWKKASGDVALAADV